MRFIIRLANNKFCNYVINRVSYFKYNEWFNWGMFNNRKYWDKYPELKPTKDCKE